MPAGNTCFQHDWLEKTLEPNSQLNSTHKVGDIFQADTSDVFKARCKVCKSSFSVKNNGLYAIIEHHSGN